MHQDTKTKIAQPQALLGGESEAPAPNQQETAQSGRAAEPLAGLGTCQAALWARSERQPRRALLLLSEVPELTGPRPAPPHPPGDPRGEPPPRRRLSSLPARGPRRPNAAGGKRRRALPGLPTPEGGVSSVPEPAKRGFWAGTAGGKGGSGRCIRSQETEGTPASPAAPRHPAAGRGHRLPPGAEEASLLFFFAVTTRRATRKLDIWAKPAPVAFGLRILALPSPAPPRALCLPLVFLVARRRTEAALVRIPVGILFLDVKYIVKSPPFHKGQQTSGDQVWESYICY
ncbi:translation initiation factor IF-2-like [Podarcis raffonei]|uniref:translation initiation factor IF-2-like n=1 Tax=Podarcis raffonei TaxID=65483 RepID=UPI0023296CFA|nr:translation initiation factor IF-2-like [Podarcis raffonei]